MDSTKKEAILAFYNAFSDDLHTELCGSLADVRFLLHTVVRFVENGKLEFHDHTNFGFHETVNFLRNMQPKLGGRLTDRLDWRSADSGEQIQIGKILFTLIYAIRLERPTELITYMQQLPVKYNRTIAAVIGHLDREEEHDENEEDVLASLLAVDDHHRRSSSGTPQKAGGSFMASPLYDRSNNNSIMLAPLSGSRLPGIEQTPQRGLLSHNYTDVFGDADSTTRSTTESPIAYVVRSPRGKHIERIRQLTRELENAKSTLRASEREWDDFKYSVESELREKTTELGRLRRRLELATEKANRAEEMQRQLTDTKALNNRQTGRIELLESELQRLSDVRSRLMLDCEASRQRIELLEERMRSLDEANDQLRRELSDAREIVDFTNKKLIAAECDVDAYRMKCTVLCEKHENELAAKDRLIQQAHSQKADTLQRQLETAEMVKQQYHFENDQLREALNVSQRINEERRSEMEELREKLITAEATIIRLAGADEQNVKLSARLEEAQSVNFRLQDQLDCTDAMLQMRGAFADSPRQSEGHPGVPTDDEFDMRFFTPKTAFGGDDASVLRVADENSLATIDLCQEQEDEFLSQTSTNGTDETLVVEQSAVYSRHSAESLHFIRESDGCPVRSTCTQTETNRKSSMRRVMKFFHNHLRHSRETIGRPGDTGSFGALLRSGSTSAVLSRSNSSSTAVGFQQTPAARPKTTAPVPRTIDFDRDDADVDCEEKTVAEPDFYNHVVPLDKIVEEPPLIVETPKETRKPNRRRSFLPTFSK